MSSLLSGIPFILDEDWHPAIYFEDSQRGLAFFKEKGGRGKIGLCFLKNLSVVKDNLEDL